MSERLTWYLRIFTIIKVKFRSIQKRIRDLVKAADWLIDSRFGILIRAVQTFTAARGAQAAASVAFYAVFSLFPLLLLIISVGSYFVDPEKVFQLVTGLIGEYFPTSTDLINANLDQVFHARGAYGVVALFALLWAASLVFTNLAYNIHLAWTDARRRHFLHKRLVGLAMTVSLSLMLVLFLGLNWVMSLDIVLNLLNSSALFKSIWGHFSTLASWITVFLLLFGLYRLAPGSPSRWRAIFWGALTATVGWKATTAIISWYLKTLVDGYRLIYGSLGAIVLFLFLVYVLSIIALFGAHLAASIDRQRLPHPKGHSNP
jgi:membrane protein